MYLSIAAAKRKKIKFTEQLYACAARQAVTGIGRSYDCHRSHIVVGVCKYNFSEGEVMSRTPQSKCDPMHLTYAQAAAWYAHGVISKCSHLDKVVDVWHTPQDISISAIRRAFESLLSRHEALRTYYRLDAATGEPVQLVQEELALPLTIFDSDKEGRMTGTSRLLPEVLSELQQRSFILANEPSWRSAVVVIEGEVKYLLFVSHRIMLDLLALAKLKDEFIFLLKGLDPTELPEPLQPRELAHMQKSSSGCIRLDRTLRYWRKCLMDAPPRIFPDRSHDRKTNLHVRQCVLETSITEGALESAARKSRITPASLILTLMAISLSKDTEDGCVPINVASSNRFARQMHSLISPVSQSSLIVVKITRAAPFSALARYVQRMSLNAYLHASYDAEALRKVKGAVEDERQIQFETFPEYNYQTHSIAASRFDDSSPVRTCDRRVEFPPMRFVENEARSAGLILFAKASRYVDLSISTIALDAEFGNSLIYGIRNGLIAVAEYPNICISDILKTIQNPT